MFGYSLLSEGFFMALALMCFSVGGMSEVGGWARKHGTYRYVCTNASAQLLLDTWLLMKKTEGFPVKIASKLELGEDAFPVLKKYLDDNLAAVKETVASCSILFACLRDLGTDETRKKLVKGCRRG